MDRHNSIINLELASYGYKSDSPPLVSVVIPTFNRAYCLDRAIRSVMDQTYQNWELIIVDNHSTDSTDDLVESYSDSRIRMVKIQNSGIIAMSRNKGLREALGKFIAFLDSDDWWVPCKLEESIKALQMGVEITYHKLYLVTSKTWKPTFWNVSKSRNLHSPIFNDLLMHGHAINTSSVVVSRDMLNKIQGFSENPSLIGIEDYDAWLRLSKITESFKNLNKTLGYYWDGGGNVSSAENTIRNLESLSDVHQNIETGQRYFDISPGYAFAMGRSKLELKKFHEAEAYFRVVLIRAPRFSMLIRSLIFMCTCRLKKYFHQNFRSN